jgi:hypothetical protein
MKISTAVLTLLATGITSLPAWSTPIKEDLISQSATDTVTIQKSRLGRAQNLARQAAEQANGGLTKYRAERSMFGDPKDSPFVDNGNSGWIFTFKGGAPNAPEPTIETVVNVSSDFSKIIVEYNGPIR